MLIKSGPTFRGDGFGRSWKAEPWLGTCSAGKRRGELLRDQFQIVLRRRRAFRDAPDPLQRAITSLLEPTSHVQKGVVLQVLSCLLQAGSDRLRDEGVDGRRVEVWVAHLQDVDLHRSQSRGQSDTGGAAERRACRDQQRELACLAVLQARHGVEIGGHPVGAGEPAEHSEPSDHERGSPGYQTRCQLSGGSHDASTSAPRPGSAARSRATNSGWARGHALLPYGFPSTRPRQTADTGARRRVPARSSWLRAVPSSCIARLSVTVSGT